jgi:hypothetical protein
MTSSITSRRQKWLWCVLFGLLTVLLGAYLVAAHLSQKPFEFDIFLYFCVNALGLGISIYSLQRS